MKIKNVALSLAWLTAVTIWVSQMGVFAASDIGIEMDLTNAIQHMVSVKIIWSSESTLQNAGSNLFGIATENFILSKGEENLSSGEEINKIIESKWSNILWWVSNKIEGWSGSTILWWESNENNGKYSTILWWKSNKIGNASASDYSTIVGWNNNKVNWNGSVIIGWSEGEINWNYSAVLWSRATVKWDNSVALWKNSVNNANNSFLWTDGNHEDDKLTTSNVFVVKWQRWMVVNANKPHSLAQLTIWWPLVVNEWGGDVSCDPTHKWVLKVVKPESGTSNHICFCSCNGDGYWHSLYGQWRCEWKCNGDYEKKAGCGEKYAICERTADDGTKYNVFVWSCNGDSKPVTWEWAYFVDYQGKVHWTCQTDAGMTVRDPNDSNKLVQCEADISKKENNSPLCNS